ncbi:type III effector protein [Ralstonia sp. TCR112]|uniref:type III effector protein n=1 Tax=Ralstonia sp. TCR112 TaxID=2601730 RepID=UPI0021C349F0|nr:type III effector protein [Ralstonia sp. TCR112]
MTPPCAGLRLWLWPSVTRPAAVVLMLSSTSCLADALVDRIRSSLRQAAETRGLAARHARFYEAAQALRSEILELVSEEPDDPALLTCAHVFREETQAFKQAHAIARLAYSPEVDQRYPFRDDIEQPILITALEPTGRVGGRFERYLADAVWPYLQVDVTPSLRGGLYHRTLVCRRLQRADLRDPREEALIGERGVFAVRDIAVGECLGVYGGRLMTPATYYTCLDDSFVLSTSAGGIDSWVDGENILAMANTSFAYERGQADRQAESGYNMEAAVFEATSRCGRRFAIRAFFATERVAAGAELRWNYRYPPELIRQRFGGQVAV